MSNHAQIEFRHYRYFLAVAKELHFRKAAEHLHISQPALSKQIKQLEEILGLILFVRHNRKVSLTRAGLYLQQELSQHFKQLDDFVKHAKLLDQGLEGELRLGFVGSAMQQIIPQLLLEFEKNHPNILVKLNELDNHLQIDALLAQQIDIGFVRIDQIPNDLIVQSEFVDTFSLVLPKNHPISASNFLSVSQLKDEAFILFDPTYSESYYAKVMHIFEEVGFRPKVSHSTVNASSIYRLVENGLGISIVPTSLQHGFNLEVKFIELKNIPQRTTLKMLWNKLNQNPVLAHFLEQRF
jgi:DNA-binding transcriptional LysR family regulator